MTKCADLLGRSDIEVAPLDLAEHQVEHRVVAVHAAVQVEQLSVGGAIVPGIDRGGFRFGATAPRAAVTDDIPMRFEAARFGRDEMAPNVAALARRTG